MLGLVIHVTALVLLVCLWLVGDVEGRTKLVFTGLYVLTWVLLFVNVWALLGAQALFALVVGTMTFAKR
jgi:hypothetical protein